MHATYPRYSSLSYATLGQQGTVATRARVPRTAWSSQIYLTDLYLDMGSLADGGRFRHLRCHSIGSGSIGSGRGPFVHPPVTCYFSGGAGC